MPGMWRARSSETRPAQRICTVHPDSPMPKMPRNRERHRETLQTLQGERSSTGKEEAAGSCAGGGRETADTRVEGGRGHGPEWAHRGRWYSLASESPLAVHKRAG